MANKHVQETIIQRDVETFDSIVFHSNTNKFYCFKSLELVKEVKSKNVYRVHFSYGNVEISYKPVKWFLCTNLTNLMRKTFAFRNIGKVLYYRPLLQERRLI